MAITSGYVGINEQGKPEGTFHTQIDCSSRRAERPVETLHILEEDGEQVVRYRGGRQAIKACSRCKPELKWQWQDDAKCLGLWPAVDPINIGQGKYYEARRFIKEYCNHCPVIRDCAEFALARPEATVGIWGGVLVGASNSKAHKEGIQALRVKHGILPSSDAA